MLVEIDNNLFDAYCKMVQFMQANGRKEDEEPVNISAVESWIEEGAGRFMQEYINNCADTWEGNEQFMEIERAFRTYQNN